jgi:predicted nucleic acid-binding protein
MRVLVDSSVWVDFFNGAPTAEAQELATLIETRADVCTCGVVVAEVFQGLRRAAGRDPLADLFRHLTLLEPAGLDPYFRAADLYRQLREGGVTIRSTIDCLIAILAQDHGCLLLFRDRDLKAIVASGLLQLKACPS